MINLESLIFICYYKEHKRIITPAVWFSDFCTTYRKLKVSKIPQKLRHANTCDRTNFELSDRSLEII